MIRFGSAVQTNGFGPTLFFQDEALDSLLQFNEGSEYATIKPPDCTT
jgi:hypothetical protein